MQESDVQHLLCIVTTIFADVLVLEVRLENIALFLKFLDINGSLGHRRLPALVRELNSVAKSLDSTLKDLVLDLVDLELRLQLSDKVFHL